MGLYLPISNARVATQLGQWLLVPSCTLRVLCMSVLADCAPNVRADLFQALHMNSSLQVVTLLASSNMGQPARDARDILVAVQELKALTIDGANSEDADNWPAFFQQVGAHPNLERLEYVNAAHCLYF